MPKAKLKVHFDDIKKVKVASEFSGVIVLKDATKQIGKDVHITLSTPSTSNYIEFGKLLATVNGNELDEAEKKAEKVKSEKA